MVDYRDVVADPTATIERTYEQLGLPITPEFHDVLVAEGKRAREHKSGHSYSLAEFGLEADEIRTQLADLFERFGWDEGAGEAPADQGGA